MKTNTLVTHKKMSLLGIGCISKVASKKAKVNFGKEDVMTCSLNSLTPVDTAKCKTITFNEYKSRVLSTKSNLNDCIVGNELMHFVGIGWICTRVVTEDDLKKYARVI